MTAQQMKYFFLLCDKAGVDKNEAEQKAKSKYGKTKFTDLTSAEVAPLIQALENMAKEVVIEEKLPDFPDEYRVWDKTEHKMIHDMSLLAKVSWEPTAEPERFHFMQYTGKKDDTQQKLYDFDFVKSYVGKTYLIQWSWTDCAWVGYDTETNQSMLLSAFGKLTKIGNVYEPAT